MLASVVMNRHQPRALPLPARLFNVQTFRHSNVLTTFTPNSFPLNSLADPHPLNPVASILYKKGGGRGAFLGFQLSTVQPSNIPTWLDPKLFTCNTYEPLRKCCKQKTYSETKSFRCNTYKKQGGPPPLFDLHTGTFLRLIPFICHSYENTGGGGGFFPFWNSLDDCRRLAPPLPKASSFSATQDFAPIVQRSFTSHHGSARRGEARLARVVVSQSEPKEVDRTYGRHSKCHGYTEPR